MRDGRDAVRSAIGWAAVALGGTLFVLFAYEWWVFVIRGDFGRAREYPFGTEQGWNYSNPIVYGWSALWCGLVALAVAIFIRSELVRRSWRWLAGAALIYGAAVVVDRVCGSMHWWIWRG